VNLALERGIADAPLMSPEEQCLWHGERGSEIGE
jgi:hypothetical protein